MSDEGRRARGLLGRLKGALGDDDREKTPERRSSRRVRLPISVRLKIETHPPTTRTLVDMSQHGLRVEGIEGGKTGDAVTVRFDGYPDVCEPFILAGEVVRTTADPPPGLVIHIDRDRTPAEALQQYRTLVLHYIRHKPLLDELGRGYFEGRCPACGWIGRVGLKGPTCSRCGKPVVPVA